MATSVPWFASPTPTEERRAVGCAWHASARWWMRKRPLAGLPTGLRVVLTPDGTSSTTGRSPSETTAADAPQNAEGRGEPISSSTASAWGPKGDYTQSEEYRAEIPATLREWGCDEALWSKVKKKNALRRLANAGDEEHGRRRIAALKAKFAEETP